VRGGKSNKERGVAQGVVECVRGSERETKREGRERMRGRGVNKVGRGRCKREIDQRYSEREGERERDGGGGGERVRLIVRGRGHIEGKEGREI
jgi:hypothetical protein